MESMVLNRKHIYRRYDIKGSGEEADFFHLDENTGMKIFKYSDHVKKTIPNKQKKIVEMSKRQIPGIMLPKVAVLDDDGDFIGYTMNLVKTARYISNFCDLKKPCFSLAQKVAFYKRLEVLVMLAHDNSMRLVDTNPENFLIDIYKNVALIDTDNFMHNDCPCDLIPSYPAKYYATKTGDQSFLFVDEFSLAIRFLEIVVVGFYREALTSLVFERLFYIDTIIEKLDIPRELKEVLLRTISAQGQKEFIGPYLDCIADPHKRCLEMKNSSFY